MGRLRAVTWLLVSLLLSGSFTCLYVARVYADATNWWNASWLYRRSHLVTAAAGASTNYSLQFVVINASGSDSGGTVYINNKAKADFSDVRFVSFDNSTVYSCWKEVLNSGVNATFWVRISEDLSTVNKNIWVYYGNSGASAVSNGSDTFPLWFDDFSVNTIGNYTTTGTWSINTSVGCANQTDTTSAYYVMYPASLSRANSSILSRVFFGAGAYDSGIGLRLAAATGYWCQDVSTLAVQVYNYTTELATSSYTGSHAGSWQRMRVDMNSSAVWTYETDLGLSTNYTGACTTPSTGGCGFVTWATNGLYAYDYLAVRSFVFPEPAHSTWASEDVGNVPEYDYVDSQTNVDSHADHGTHSSFAAQQATDLTNDTLSEANTAGSTTSDVFSSGFEETLWNNSWDGNGATTWLRGTNSTPGSPWVTHSGTNMSYGLLANIGNLTSDDINLSGATSAGVSFWYMVDDEEATDYLFYYYNGSTYNLQTLSLGLAATEDIWWYYSETITDVQYLKSNFRLSFNNLAETGEGSFLDDVTVNATVPNTANYELDLEEQFTSANFSRTNVELCVRMGAYNTTENVRLDYWNATASAWIVAVATLTTNTWNNVSVKAYTSNSSVTFTVRFVGVTESGDTEQSAWNKDSCLLHTWDVAAGPQDLSFVNSQTVTVYGSGVRSMELGFQSSQTLLLYPFASMNLLRPFTLGQTMFGYASNVLALELGFRQSNTLLLYPNMATGKELGLSFSQVVVTFGNVVAGLAVAFLNGVSASLLGGSGTGKELGFRQSQSSNMLPNGLFAKELAFMSGQSVNVFGNSIFNKELAFLSGQTVNVFSSLTNTNAFGFLSTSTLNPFSNVLFSKELGFSSSQSLALFDWSSLNREGAFNVFDFMRGGTADLFDGLGFSKEQAYSPIQTLLSYSSGGSGKELGFFNGGMVNVFGAGLLGRELGFLNGQTLVLFGHNVFGGLGGVPAALFELWGRGSEVMSKELGFSNAPVLWLLDWGYGGGARAFTFNVSPLLRLYDSAGLMKELLFRPSALANLFGQNSFGKELGFISGQVVNVFGGNLFGRELAFQSSGLVNVFGGGLFGRGLGFMSSSTVNLFSGLSQSKELGFFTGQTVNLFSSNGVGKELGLELSQTVNVFGGLGQYNAWEFVSGNMLQWFGSTGFGKGLLFVSGQTVTAFGNLSVGKELDFLGSGAINIYGNIIRSIEVATTLFENVGTIRLFGSGIMFGDEVTVESVLVLALFIIAMTVTPPVTILALYGKRVKRRI